MAHDGSAGVSPEGWLPDRVSVGALTRTFPPELVDRVVAATDTRELRRRLLPARLVVYFVLALWLFRGPNCGYGRVMVKLVDALYHRRRGEQLLGGVLDPDGWVEAGDGRRWRPPNISSLSRARTRLGADPLHMLFDEVAGPVGAPDAAGVFCCGLRVVSMDGSTTDVPNSTANAEYFGRPSNATRDGAFPQVRWIVAAESGTGALIGATLGPYTVGEQRLARDLLPAFCAQMLVLADRNFLCHTLARDVLATGAHILWRASASFKLTPIAVLADGSYLAQLHPRRKADGPPITVRVIEYTVHTSSAGSDDEDTSELFCLVTDLLDPAVCSSRRSGLRAVRHERWPDGSPEHLGQGMNEARGGRSADARVTPNVTRDAAYRRWRPLAGPSATVGARCAPARNAHARRFDRTTIAASRRLELASESPLWVRDHRGDRFAPASDWRGRTPVSGERTELRHSSVARITCRAWVMLRGQ